jgi:hypothetical protein
MAAIIATAMLFRILIDTSRTDSRAMSPTGEMAVSIPPATDQ